MGVAAELAPAMGIITLFTKVIFNVLHVSSCIINAFSNTFIKITTGRQAGLVDQVQSRNVLDR